MSTTKSPPIPRQRSAPPQRAARFLGRHMLVSVIAGLVLAVLLGVYLLLQVVQLQGTVAAQQSAIDTTQLTTSQSIAELQASADAAAAGAAERDLAISELRAELERQGVDPDEVAPLPAPIATSSAASGGRPPTPEEVAAAVAAYCSTGACAAQPSDAQVANAVAAYCGAGACTGAGGAAGLPGASGATGATGPAGPGPTAEQLAVAVATYCTSNACTGPAGPQGDQGPVGPSGAPGAAGVSITSVQCADDGSFVFGFSDGTTQAVGSGCDGLL